MFRARTVVPFISTCAVYAAHTISQEQNVTKSFSMGVSNRKDKYVEHTQLCLKFYLYSIPEAQLLQSERKIAETTAAYFEYTPA